MENSKHKATAKNVAVSVTSLDICLGNTMKNTSGNLRLGSILSQQLWKGVLFCWCLKLA